MRRVAMILVVAAVACVPSWAGANDSATVGSKAPAFSLLDQDGKTVRIEDYAGKVVVLEWVNPDCPFVKRHAAAGTMRDLASRYADKGVVWLGINSTHYMNASASAAFRTASSLPYPILVDSGGEVGRAYGARTTPHMFIIDARGVLVYDGAIDDDPRGSNAEGSSNYVARALDELLEGKTVTVTSTTAYGCSVKYAR